MYFAINNSLTIENTWYIIANPTSGNGAVKKKWSKIIAALKASRLTYEFSFSEYHLHEIDLVQKAIKKGYKKFISIGGDGTLHHIVNGIMSQNEYNPLNIKVGVIPLGTGNDWVKTYKIPKNITKAINIIEKEKTIYQDIGKINLLQNKESIYFNNLAGMGFDGYVIKNIEKFKKFGSLSYLFSTIFSFINYKKSELTIEIEDQKIITKSLLTLVGICQFSGGGMQLTKDVNTKDGLFDISIAKNFTIVSMLINISKFFNGKITNHKQVETYKTSEVKIKSNNETSFIQADGELVGQGGFIATVIPNTLQFIIA